MNDDQHRYLNQVCDRPGMFVGSSEFDRVCAYIDGLHAATGCLTGFREWLVVEIGTGNNLAWIGLVRQIIHRDSTPVDDRVAKLGQLLNDFHEYAGSTIGATTGLMRVYLRYHGWLLQQKWYKPDWIGYVPPYDKQPENAG